MTQQATKALVYTDKYFVSEEEEFYGEELTYTDDMDNIRKDESLSTFKGVLGWD